MERHEHWVALEVIEFPPCSENRLADLPVYGDAVTVAVLRVIGRDEPNQALLEGCFVGNLLCWDIPHLDSDALKLFD